MKENIVFELNHFHIRIKAKRSVHAIRPFLGEQYSLSSAMWKQFQDKYQDAYGERPKITMISGWEVTKIRHHMEAEWIEVALTKD